MGSLQHSLAPLGPNEALGLQDQVVALVESARRVDTRRLEEHSRAHLLEHFLPLVRDLIAEGLRTANRILQQLDDSLVLEPDLVSADAESSSPSNRTFLHAVDRFAESRDLPDTKLQDFAFVVIAEMREKSARLEALRPDLTEWEIIAEGTSVLRRIVKAFSAVENALAAQCGIPTRLSFTSELEVSLRIRRYYADLRSRMASSQDLSLVGRFRQIGTEFAILRGKPVYGDLRITDRVHILRLQTRILDWLRKADSREESAACRLWQDIAGFMQFTTQINQRQELVEHDAATVAEALQAIRDGSWTAKPDELLVASLQRLKGLDDTVDQLLRTRVMESAEWLPHLTRLRRALDGAAEGHPPSGPGSEG